MPVNLLPRFAMALLPFSTHQRISLFRNLTTTSNLINSLRTTSLAIHPFPPSPSASLRADLRHDVQPRLLVGWSSGQNQKIGSYRSRHVTRGGYSSNDIPAAIRQGTSYLEKGTPAHFMMFAVSLIKFPRLTSVFVCSRRNLQSGIISYNISRPSSSRSLRFLHYRSTQ